MDETTLSRLLHMYPADVLRERWELKSQTKENLIEQVVATMNADEIFKFCRDFHRLTKQRIMLFKNTSGNLRSFGAPLIYAAAAAFSTRQKQAIEEFYLLPVTYTALVGPPYEKTTLEFLWPISIVVDSNFARVTFTIIEKNINSYLPADVSAYDIHKEYDEQAVCDRFLRGVSMRRQLEPADINKGVKSLWRNDEIDALYNASKTSCSTHTEAMDAQKLMKRHTPKAFTQAMKEPLLKTVFRTLLPEGTYPPFFTVNPSEGWLTISRYPKTSIEVDNVVRAILAAS